MKRRHFIKKTSITGLGLTMGGTLINCIEEPSAKDKHKNAMILKDLKSAIFLYGRQKCLISFKSRKTACVFLVFRLWLERFLLIGLDLDREWNILLSKRSLRIFNF